MKIIKESSLISEIESGYQILWPFGIEIKNGMLTAKVSEELADKIEFISDMTETELSSTEVIDKLITLIENEVERNGYEISYGKNRIYKMTRREDVNKALILDSSEVLMPEGEYESMIDVDVDALEAGCLAFATVLDGTIVSIASENPYREDENVVNIGVETAEEYRKNGYGTSNVAALTYYLLDTGMTVEYTVDNENEVSMRLCEKIGFALDRFVLNIFAHKQG
ncbi:MAG: GNAT family N-acetyltransferase [Clostridia bacterium]|nr:GNAT family N-acetyltransferase [Clostridia bacterium]